MLVTYKDYTEMHGQGNIKLYNHLRRIEFSERRIFYSIVCFSCYLNFPVNSLYFYKDALSENKEVIVAKVPSEWSLVSCVLLICLKKFCPLWNYRAVERRILLHIQEVKGT
jgi:hypothetical protein